MGSLSTRGALAIRLASQCDRGKIFEHNRGTARHTSTPLGDLLIVADHAGSDAGGSQASQIAVDTISSCIEAMPTPLFFPPELAIAEAIAQANAAIVASAAQPDHRENRVATRVVVALLRRDAEHAQAYVQAIIGRMGDGRAYLVHNQKLTLLTPDDSTGHESLDPNWFTPLEEEGVPDASMLANCLGKQVNGGVETRDVQLEVGDTLLLCSDGLRDCVSEQEIERALSDGTRTVEEVCRALLDLALEAGGDDNLAIEIARLAHSSDTAAAAECAIELRSETPPQTEFHREVVPASDTRRPKWPIAQEIVETGDPGSERPLPSKRNRVSSLIRGFGKRISDKNSIVGKSAILITADPSGAEVRPIVSWAPPEPIVYGTRLSSVQLSAAASVQGEFLYTPGPGYLLPAGTHTLWATFYAAGEEDHPVLTEVSIRVSKATPSLHWPTPAQMAPGVALGTAQLNASASVPGTFEYSPAHGEVIADGTHTLSVTFVPTDNANYTTAQATVPVTVAKAAPKIEWDSPSPIPCGTPLGVAQLNASASVPGRFEYFPAAGELLSAGSHILLAIFYPSDDASYSRAEEMVSLTVTRATPTISWPTPDAIPYGTLLSDAHLNATASVPGTFVYTPGPGTLLSAGEHTPSVVFTPSDLSDYIPAQAAVSLRVTKAHPAIHWPLPQRIIRGTPLGSAQLNASASVPGSFSYSPAIGEILAPGTHSLEVSFTPADSVNYTPAEASVSLTVPEIIPASVRWLDPHSISYGAALSAEQLNASCSVPGSFIYAPAAGEVLPPGKHKLSAIFTPKDEEKHARGQASVTLIVEQLPDVSSLLRAHLQAPLDRAATDHAAASAAAESGIARRDDHPSKNPQRETRIYRGALYAKGDDGQWHLERR